MIKFRGKEDNFLTLSKRIPYDGVVNMIEKEVR
jgi:hypothetical protein